MFCEKNRSLKREIRVSAMNMMAGFQNHEGISLLRKTVPQNAEEDSRIC